MLLDTSIDLLDVSHDLDPNNLTLEHIHLGKNDSDKRAKSSSAGNKKAAGAGKPRPSWGPPSSAISSDAKKQNGSGKMRLLQGLQDDWDGAAAATTNNNNNASSTTTRRGLGGMMDADPRAATSGAAGGKGAKPRFSLFAKPAFNQPPTAAAAAAGPSASASASAAPSSGPRDGTTGDPVTSEGGGGIAAQRAMEDAPPTQEGRGESKEAVAKQLAELKMMNETFESYERMLRGATEQIDVSHFLSRLFSLLLCC